MDPTPAQLKRLLHNLVSAVVLSKGKASVSYWTRSSYDSLTTNSNSKMASDQKSGATSLLLYRHRKFILGQDYNSTLPLNAKGSHNMVKSGYVVKNGAGEANTDAHLCLLSYPHDIINFFQNPANSNFDEFLRLYQKGLSLKEVSQETDFPLSTVRDVLVSNKVPLRANKKAIPDDPEKPQRAFWGAIPYGYNVLDGKLVLDPRETKIVRKILALHQKGMSFNAIAKKLTQEKIISKTGRRWNDKTVAAIIRRTKSE